MKHTLEQVETAIEVLRSYMETKGNKIAERIDKLPDSRYYDNMVTRMDEDYQKECETLERVIVELSSGMV